nr:hypothetical protein 3 [Desulfobulbaceae bacterium]
MNTEIENMAWKSTITEAVHGYTELKAPKQMAEGFSSNLGEANKILAEVFEKFSEIDADPYLNPEGTKHRKALAQAEGKKKADRWIGQKHFDQMQKDDLAKMHGITKDALNFPDELRLSMEEKTTSKLLQAREDHKADCERRLAHNQVVSDEETAMDAAFEKVVDIIRSEHRDRNLILSAILNQHPFLSPFSEAQLDELRYLFAEHSNPDLKERVAFNKEMQTIYDSIHSGMIAVIDSLQTPVAEDRPPMTLDDAAAILGQVTPNQ